MPLKYPEWQQPYKSALLEFDPQKLARLVADTETAMSCRLQTLSSSPNGQDERQAIADAANALLMLKRDILQCPELDLI
jgi:hypothetical protein